MSEAHTLIKLSAPGWEFRSTSERLIFERLHSGICHVCRDDVSASMSSKDLRGDVEILLGTDCGCEYMVEWGQDAKGI